MNVPEEVPIASNAILTVEIRSFRDPSVQHTVEHSTQINGAQPSEPIGSDEPNIFSDFMQRWLQTILIVIVSIVGTVAVAFAVRHRIEADREFYRSKNLSLIHI